MVYPVRIVAHVSIVLCVYETKMIFPVKVRCSWRRYFECFIAATAKDIGYICQHVVQALSFSFIGHAQRVPDAGGNCNSK